MPERYIDWEDVDPVETSIASIKLRVPHAGLAELHPADLATIIDQLAPRDRAGVLASLDDEAAADAIEEMEPETQVEVLEDLEPGARGRHPRGDEPGRRGRPRGRPVRDGPRGDPRAHGAATRRPRSRSCSRYPEDTAGGIMTTEFVAVPADLTAAETIDRLRELEPDAETIYYVYVTDDDGRLVGVLSLRDLIVAEPETRSRDVMIEEPVTVGVLRRRGRGRRRSSRATTCWPCRWSTTSGRLVGIVTVDDAIDTVLPDRLEAAPAARAARAER